MRFLVASVVVIGFALAGQANAELLDNRDFENGLDDWSHYGSGSGSGSWGYAWLSGYADIAPSGGSDGGQYALLDTYFLDPDGYMSSWGWVYVGVWSETDAPMTTGDSFTFEGYAKDLEQIGDSVHVNVEYFVLEDLDGDGNNDRVDLDGSGGYEQDQDRTILEFPLVGDGSWEHFGASMTVPESLGQQIDLVRLFWYSLGTGTIGIDQLSFVLDPGLLADFDENGSVDGDDFLIWQAGFKVDDRGDANGDGATDGDDFLIWQSEFGSGDGSSSVTVPEPAAIVLLITALAACLFIIRRQ